MKQNKNKEMSTKIKNTLETTVWREGEEKKIKHNKKQLKEKKKQQEGRGGDDINA